MISVNMPAFRSANETRPPIGLVCNLPRIVPRARGAHKPDGLAVPSETPSTRDGKGEQWVVLHFLPPFFCQGQHHPYKTAHPLVFGSFAWDSLLRKFFARSIAFCCWRKHSGQIPWVVGVSNPFSMNFSSGIHSPLWSMRRHQAQTRINASSS